jgi:glutamate-1-semialdehyde 2,1-aminomutase
LQQVVEGFRRLAQRHQVPVQVAQAGLMWGFFFNAEAVTDFASASRSHDGRWQVFFRAMTARGILMPPSPYEASFWSSAHGATEVKVLLAAIDGALAEVKAAHG